MHVLNGFYPIRLHKGFPYQQLNGTSLFDVDEETVLLLCFLLLRELCR